MYPAKDARELAILLRISREFDVVGDVTATVDNPSELLAWALTLTRPDVVAWRAGPTGHRFIQVTADRSRPPVRGRVTAVLASEQHLEYWDALGLADLEPGQRHELDVPALSAAWAIMPVGASGTEAPTPAEPPTEQAR
ncbi:hypothetical protein GCM10022237_06880 [Nocardioides ginsengisoli]|uniref:Uncharacterized protein n=1 Tax=Nocardioides ginsengisoli TaxID=363868 RepID=A0ABW3VX93_9ACTN